MIMLSEFLLPERYPPELFISADSQPAAAQGGGQSAMTSGPVEGQTGPPESPTALAAEVAEAAQQVGTGTGRCVES
jgi:hypothetical protein